MQIRVFKIAIIIFAISFAMLLMAIFSYLDLLDEALSHPDFDNLLGDAIKSIFELSEYMGWYEFFICAISGITAAISNPHKKRR